MLSLSLGAEAASALVTQGTFRSWRC